MIARFTSCPDCSRKGDRQRVRTGSADWQGSGSTGEAGAIKVSTKALHDIAPPHLLLAVALSIADVLSIDAIAGVGNDDQLAKSSEEVSGCYFDYDAFWNKFFFNKNAANFYEAHIPPPEKPLEQFRRDRSPQGSY